MSAELIHMPGTDDKHPGYRGPDRRTKNDDENVRMSEVREAVAEGFKVGIQQTFASLGLDLTDPEDLVAWYADMKHLRDLRLSNEHRTKAGIAGNVNLRNGFITAIISAALAFLVAKFTK